MRRLDDTPIDPEIADALDAIDATLAGEPVDPRHAELAELALLLTESRPRPEPSFGAELDQRVERRFAAPGGGHRVARKWLPMSPAFGAFATGLAAAIAVVVVLTTSGGGSPALRTPAAQSAAAGGAASSGSASSGSASSGSAATAAPAIPPAPGANPTSSAHTATGKVAGSAASAPAPVFVPATTPNAGAVSQSPSPRPAPSPRKIEQSAQLTLTTEPKHVDDVAQQVFNVAASVNGIVNSSSVTATGGPDGYAEFQLSIPSANLPRAMAQLSSLTYAQVVSRTDSTQDVQSQYNAATNKLADDQAMRASLLTRIAHSSSSAQTAILQAQLKAVEAKIASDQRYLAGLNHQIAYSPVSVTIQAGGVVPVGSGGGFTLGKAAHDAGRVLEVAAGVALIVLAVLVPVGLVTALGWWIGTTVRRRRREHALDLA
jgi:hypothetical protein